MPSTATSRNRFEKQGTGDNTNTWGAKLNTTGLDLIDEALDGYESIAVTGDLTLTSTNYASDQARKRFLKFTGSVAATITIPAVSKLYFIWNATSASLVISTGGATTATLVAGARQWVVCDGSAVYIDTSATNAAASASSAATSASNASTSATSASNSATSATASASAAATSETNAATSATNAANSATAAAASAASVDASNLVDRTTAQTIGGLKTFSDGIRVNSQTLDGLTAFGVSLAEASDAAAANALLGSRSWTLISTSSASGASISQTGLADYGELVVVYDGVSHNDGSSRALLLFTSENNGSSYPSGNSITNAIVAGATLTGASHVILTGRATILLPVDSVGSLLTPSFLSQAGTKANAIKLQWAAGSFDAGTVYIYGR